MHPPLHSHSTALTEPAFSVRAVLFDLDDTLLDHRGAARDALIAWSRDADVEGSDLEMEARWRMLETTYYQRFQRGELTKLEQRRARIRQFCAPRVLSNVEADNGLPGLLVGLRRRMAGVPGRGCGSDDGLWRLGYGSASSLTVTPATSSASSGARGWTCPGCGSSPPRSWPLPNPTRGPSPLRARP